MVFNNYKKATPVYVILKRNIIIEVCQGDNKGKGEGGKGGGGR